jgi:hypothetical protein
MAVLLEIKVPWINANPRLIIDLKTERKRK